MPRSSRSSHSCSSRRRHNTTTNNFFEPLERRDLFSQNIRVATFGARPNDGIDDYAAIAAAVATAKPGDRIRFAAGEYDLSDKVQIPSGVSLIGYGSQLGGQTTIHAADHNFAFYFRGDGLKIDHMTFDGGALYMDRYNAPITNVLVEYSKFLNPGRGGDVGAANGAIGAAGNAVDGFQLSNNSFQGDGTGTGMYIYTGDDWNIHDNEFIDLHCGVKSNNEGWMAHNITIARNYFTQFDYHSVEMQGTVHGFWFTDNYYDNPRLSSNFTDNDSTFAFSLIYAGNSIDQHILRNYISAPQRPDGTGVRLGFEAGEYCEIKDNYIAGIGTPWTFYGPHSYADGNYFSNILQWPYSWGPYSTKSVITSNNGDRVKVSWNVDRPRPGPALTTEAVDHPESLGSTSGSGSAVVVPQQPAQRNVTYASDLQWAGASSGVGLVQRDSSSTGKSTDEKAAISISNQKFDKGFGVTGASTIVYALNGGYKTFITDFGIDDRSGSKGTMTFQLWADGKLVYDSGLLTGRDDLRSITLDVRKVQQLKLVTTDGGDGKGHDLGDWGGSRFYS